jgi:prevent-host-death family protein
MKKLSITRARKELTSLPELLAEETRALAVTRRGEPVLAVMPWEHYEALLETLEVLADDELIPALRKSLREVAAGETYDWESVRAELVG